MRTPTATMALLAAVFVAGCSASSQAGSQAATTTSPTTRAGAPVEVLLADTGTDVEPVVAQCDGHGHRVYASRHPIDFVVINDPTCPSGPPAPRPPQAHEPQEPPR